MIKSVFIVLLSLLLFGSCQPTSAQQGEETTTFILLRHAEKAADGSKNPPLTEQGHKRALALAKLFSQIPVSAVYSSNYSRTLETAKPIATQNKLEIQLYEPHKEGPLLENLKKDYAGKTIVMVGHSNSIPGVVNQLLGEERLQDLDEQEYDNVFVVSLNPDGKASLLPLVLALPPTQ